MRRIFSITRFSIACSGVLLLMNQEVFPQGQKRDTTKLPFAIADEKKLSDEDIKDKKEGIYITGTPDFSSDPVNGIGYGAEGSLYFNGHRNDPFFYYTAYRAKLDFIDFSTTKNEREFFLKLDVPYILNTKWRVGVVSGDEEKPKLLFFFLKTQETIRGLTFYSCNPP